MNAAASLLSMGLLVSGGSALAQEPTPTETPTPGPQAEPAPLPRVVGQAQSQDELDAWTAIEQASEVTQKENLARLFFQNYPDSGLTPYVHYSLAGAYRRTNQNDKFVEAAEKALTELPWLPEISSYLAFLYAETGHGEAAARWAQATLEALREMSRPTNVSPADWARASRRSRGDAEYALGRVELSQAIAVQDQARIDLLTKAAGHFRDAIREDPRNPYASFRLGSVYRNLNQAEEAIQAYARTVALGGIIEPYARRNLREIYDLLKRDPDDMDEVIDRQKKSLEEELARIQQELRELEETASPSEPKPELVTEPAVKPPPR